YMNEGLAPTTAGDVAQILFGEMEARGALAWLDTSSFDETLDSNGDPWDTDQLQFRADAGEQFGTHVLGDLERMGYEKDVRPKPTPEGGFDPADKTHDLLLWNPGGRSSGETIDQAIVAGSVENGSKFAKRRVSRTHILVETDEGERNWVTDSRLAGLPRRESFIRAEYAYGSAGAQQVASAAFEDDISNLFASQVR